MKSRSILRMLVLCLAFCGFALSASASGWSALGSGMNNFVYATAWDGVNLYAGGYFTLAGGASASYVAKWDGSAWNPLGTGLNGNVYALAWDGTNLYAGGFFSMAGGASASNIARWDGSTWTALGSGTNNLVRALAWDGANLYAGGFFTTAGGTPVNYVAKWDGSNWTALGTGMNSRVSTLAWDGANLYAGGHFTNAGGTSAFYIARWDGSTWNSLGSGMDSYLLALAWDGTSLYAGGDFTHAGGTSAHYIAKWDGSSWSALGSGMNGDVSALGSDGANLYAGGIFSTAGGVAANYIASWNGSSWSALDSGMNGTVWALTWDGANLDAGGYFTTAGGVTAPFIAMWTPTCVAASIITQPASQTIPSGETATMSVVAGGTAPLSYQWYVGNSGDTSNPIAGATTDTYTTPPLTNTTSYWVRVTGPCGSADSDTAVITVVTGCVAPSITTQPASQTIGSGETATMSVVADGTAPLSYQWYVGNSGDTSSPISGATTDTYTTAPLITTTSYWVRVSNACGNADSTTAVITVISGCIAPSITAQPANQTIAGGQTATMAVVAGGSAPLSYQWYVGNSGDTSSPISGATADTYTTPALIATTSYWVRVSNACGNADSATATITVSGTCIFCDDFSSLDFNTSFGPFLMKPPGSFSAVTGDAVGRTASKADLISPDFGGCTNCTFESHLSINTAGARISFYGWYQDASHRVELRLSQDKQTILIKQKSGSISAKKKIRVNLNVNQLYDVQVSYTGGQFQVAVDGASQPDLTLDAVGVPAGNLRFRVKSTTRRLVVGTVADVAVR